MRIRVFDRIMCFINCHLAAHLEAVNRRNADFDHIYKTMSFSRSSNANNAPAGIYLYVHFSTFFSLLKASSRHISISCLLTFAAGVTTCSHTTKSANVSPPPLFLFFIMSSFLLALHTSNFSAECNRQHGRDKTRPS